MKNTIYLVSGTIGAGKTTLTRKLIQKKNYALVDGDAMFVPLQYTSLSWDKRLSLTWENMVYITKKYLKQNLDVVIDFIVEDELEWFLDQFDLSTVEIKYIVLIANEETLTKRIKQRDGSLQFLDRSLELLNKISNKKENIPYIVDTTDREIDDVLTNFIKQHKYIIKKNS